MKDSVFHNTKITSKNAWSNTLIEHFSDIKSLKNTNSNKIDFEKASITLDGCVKVYSTRVDNVMEDTNRLMKSISSKEEVKRKVKARKSSYVEEEANIRLKIEDEDVNFLYLIKTLKDNQQRQNIMLNSLIGYQNTIGEEPIPQIYFNDERIGINFKQQFICPTLENIEINMDDYNNEEEVEREMDFEIEHNFDDYQPADCHNTVGNFITWKTSFKRREKKEKITYKIDFHIQPPSSCTAKGGDTLLSPTAIKERRKNNNIISEISNNTNTTSLYNYFILPGSFKNKIEPEIKTVPTNHNQSIVDNTAYTDRSEIRNDKTIDFEVEHNYNEKSEIGNYKTIDFEVENNYNEKSEIKETNENNFNLNIIGSQLQFLKQNKKIDTKELKEKIKKELDTNNSLSNLYKTIEEKNLSVHQCFISLLHIANENNLLLNEENNDIFITK
ncbi:Chromosome condensation complex Condensin subunit H [Spraguea lophii 42_110]|uniref:Condensin complex subunit 2 n=1 Tax=Spraguea lophii (strain 42_110) TaxID=1358809 RepID=S7W9D2_SPRLO|nr:Chromosome condensation complex Condensin subunit H [Spraguea lophii 42_110]